MSQINTKLVYAQLAPEIGGPPLKVPEKELFQTIASGVKKRQYEAIVQNLLGYVHLKNKRTRSIPKRKTRPLKQSLSRRVRKENNLLKLPTSGWNYQSLGIMRNMWCDYMKQAFGVSGTFKAPEITDDSYIAFHTKLSKCDLIGADVTVVQSKTPSLIDIHGTIVLETKHTFQVVTEKNELKILPKEPSVFTFMFNQVKFTVYGKSLLSRTHERSVKKVKNFIDLRL